MEYKLWLRPIKDIGRCTWSRNVRDYAVDVFFDSGSFVQVGRGLRLQRQTVNPGAEAQQPKRRPSPLEARMTGDKNALSSEFAGQKVLDAFAHANRSRLIFPDHPGRAPFFDKVVEVPLIAKGIHRMPETCMGISCKLTFFSYIF